MDDIKWIKLSTGLPDNRKIKQIRKLPQGDTIALMWVFLMCLAGEVNENGLVYFTKEIPYTEDMLADEFDMDLNVVKLGLATFQRFGMIDIVNDIVCLSSWEKWQSTDSLETIREQTRKRVAKHRKKQKMLACNVTSNVTVTQCNATEEDIEEEIEIELEKDNISASAKSPKPIKHKYGEYNNVLLTDDELEKLKKEYIDYEERIERLSSYVASTGKKYKSHYATIRNWAKKDDEKTVKKNTSVGNQDDLDDVF